MHDTNELLSFSISENNSKPPYPSIYTNGLHGEAAGAALF
jgi:hypothetical protein